MTDSKQIFAERLRKLLEEEGISQKQLAAKTQIAESSISKYLSCDAEPKLVPLVSIAKYFDVSIDYLLGVSNCKQYQEDMQAASKVTGLNDDALVNLSKMKKEEHEVINLVLCFPKFRKIISYINKYSSFEERELRSEKILARCETLAKDETFKDAALAQSYIDDRKENSEIQEAEKRATDRNKDDLQFLNNPTDEDKKTLLLFLVTNAITDMTKMCSKSLAEIRTEPENIEEIVEFRLLRQDLRKKSRIWDEIKNQGKVYGQYTTEV